MKVIGLVCQKCGETVNTVYGTPIMCEECHDRAANIETAKKLDWDALSMATRIAELERQLAEARAENTCLQTLDERVRALEKWRHDEETYRLEQSERM